MKTIELTEASKQLFIAHAEDAGNWSGTPMLDITKEGRGNLTQLKRAKLVETFKDGGIEFLSFTEAGIAYATELGIDLSEFSDEAKRAKLGPCYTIEEWNAIQAAKTS